MSATCAERIAKTFSRWGWLGVYVQLALMILPIFMLCYILFGKATGQDLTFDVTDYLAIFGLAILGFTTFWSFRYTRLAKRMNDPDRRPAAASITKTLWIGSWASCFGIVVSLVLLFIEVIRLLVLFLKAPQGGIPVFQTQPDTRMTWVSAIDAVSLLAEVCTLAGEFFVLGITLWLMFRFTQSADDYTRSTATAEASLKAPGSAERNYRKDQA